MVVGVMDDARADILGDGNIALSPIESASQEVYCFILPFILKSFVRRAVSWTTTLSSGRRAPLRRSVRLHGVLHTAVDIQEAVERLQIWSPSGSPRIVSRPMPKCTAVKPRAVASSRLLAMRNAVPSPSARVVFQSQALSAEESAHPVNDVGQEGSAKDPDEASARTQAAEAAVTILSHSGSSQQAVEAWLASSEPVAHIHADSIAPPSVGSITAEQQGPVAALVQQFEDLGFHSHPSKKLGHGLASLMDNSLFQQSRQHHSQQPNRTRLTPLEIPGVSPPDEVRDGGMAIVEPDKELDKSLPPVVQGVVARNDAAMAAHRARLHQKGHQKDQWAIASKQTTARRVSTQPLRPVNVSVAASRLSPDAATDEEVDMDVERSSISAAWAQIRGNNPSADLSSRPSGMSSTVVSPRRPLLGRFGSASNADGQTSSPMSRPTPAAITIADIMRQASGATPIGVGDAPLWASSPRRPPPALTIAQIMRQNTRLPPLDIAPPPGSALQTPRAANKLLRWGTHTAAELEAADHANAAAELGDADLADRPKLLRWGINTTVDLAAANARAGIASLSIHDSIPDNSIEQPAAMLAPRLLRWGASTAADMDWQQQGWPEHRQNMQTHIRGATTSAELAEPSPDLIAASQEHHTQQWQQTQGRTAGVVKHWTLLESGELPVSYDICI
ncbi:hypothetical protein WJX79_001974 [Trebouxia sp. C0005]